MKHYFEKIYNLGFEDFVFDLEDCLLKNQKKFVVTANPETLMYGVERKDFDDVLRSQDTLIVPDGIGVVKAANMLGYPIAERIAGVEVVEHLLQILDEHEKSLYLFGASEEVLERLVEEIRGKHPHIQIVGYQHGYVDDKDKVFEQIAKEQPDVVLVALGIPEQELLISRHYSNFRKGIFIGVGGAFDVLSGTKKRAPSFFIRLNLEWLYRIIVEPKRIKRFYRSNIKFISKAREMRKKK